MDACAVRGADGTRRPDAREVDSTGGSAFSHVPTRTEFDSTLPGRGGRLRCPVSGQRVHANSPAGDVDALPLKCAPCPIPLRDGTQASLLQASAKIGENTFGRDRFDIAIHNLAEPSLRLFQPRSLNRLVRRAVKLSNQGPEQDGLDFRPERSNLYLDLCYHCGHRNLCHDHAARSIVARALFDCY